VAWNCDVCGESLHYKKLDNGKIAAVSCPLEDYKNVRSYLTQDIRHLHLRFPDVPISTHPEDLKTIRNIVPRETPLNTSIIKRGKDFQVKSLIAKGSLRTFYLHYLRFLINFYGDNRVHFVEAHEFAKANQFNYLWLSTTLLRDCYLRNTHAQSKFKTMSDLLNPSLLIYGLGIVDGTYMKNKGDILMEVISSRYSQGKSTWIVHSKPFRECEEIQTCENLRLYLENASHIPSVQLDLTEEDPEIFATPIELGRTSSRRGRGTTQGTTGVGKDYSYNL